MNSAGYLLEPYAVRLKGLNMMDIGYRFGIAATSGFGLVLVFLLIRAVYNIWFHPLSKYPGPWYAATTNFVHFFIVNSGNSMPWLVAQHEKYGEVVRIGPSRLSYTNPQAWKDIYGHRTGGKKSLVKDKWFYNISELTGRPRHLAAEPDDATHGKLRKIFTNAFSDRALREQQDLLLRYVDKLIKRIRDETTADPKRRFDALRLFNFTTFDIMAELTLGEPLGMLENGEYVPWVAKIFASIRFTTLSGILMRWTTIGRLVMRMMPARLKREFDEHNAYTMERVDRRMERGSEQPDIWNLVMKLPEGNQLSKDMMYEHASVFMIAGTETTATLLSGLTYYLLRNPDTLERLVREIRSLPSEDDLTLDNLRRLEYMHACLEEGLRMYPPAPIGLPRVVPEGGAAVCGDYLPEGTRVSVPHFPTYRSEMNFKNPWNFVPERWLPGTGYDGDRKEALQPFSLGPRNCLGKNLAYHEMRLILAKVLWHYDIELCPESENWSNQKVFGVWEKHPLYVKMKPVTRI